MYRLLLLKSVDAIDKWEQGLKEVPKDKTFVPKKNYPSTSEVVEAARDNLVIGIK